MTEIEYQFYAAVKRLCMKMTSDKEIDWEQRRYEIAKDAMTSTYFGGNNGTPFLWLNDDPRYADDMAKKAVMMADALITELKKESNDKR